MTSKGKIHTPIRQRLKHARVGALPFLVWVAGVALAMELWLAAPSASTYYGLAHAPQFQVTSPVDGKLDSIHVEPHEAVQAGAPLATINDESLEADITTARAELERLAAELEFQRADMQADVAMAYQEVANEQRLSTSTAGLEYPAELRAFYADEVSLELSILATRLAIATSELQADRLEVRWRRTQALITAALGSTADVQDIERRVGVERARAESLREIHAELTLQLERMCERREDLEVANQPPRALPLPDPEFEGRLTDWRAALVVQEKRLDELCLRRQASILRAPVAGRVAAVLASSGEFVLAGDPVFLLMESKTREVALWVPESSPTRPGIGDPLVVTRNVTPSSVEMAECVVRSLSPRVEPLPQRLWRDARVPEYGRMCLVGPVASLNLIPGERVRIDPAPVARPGMP